MSATRDSFDAVQYADIPLPGEPLRLDTIRRRVDVIGNHAR